MNKILILTWIISLFLFSCVKEEEEPDPEQEQEIPEEPAFAEATIGPAGGELATEDFILTVPEGAFDTTLTLKLFVVEDEAWTDSKQVTELYGLEGLCAEFVKPLKFSIRYEGELEGESAIAFGFKYYDQETEDSVRIHELLSASDSAGFLKGSLAPLVLPESAKKSGYITDGLANYLLFETRQFISGMSKILTYQSEYAEIRYDQLLNLSRSKVEQFAQYFDEAVYFFHTLGVMDRSVFSGYRFRINILDSSPEEGYPTFVSPSLGEVNFMRLPETFKKLTKVYMIKVPGDFFEAAEENRLRMVAAEGVLKFDNYCYFSEMDSWLQWAIMYWAKRYFFGSYPILPANEDSYVKIMQPYYGMNAYEQNWDLFPKQQATARAIYHGDGISPLIAYLMDQYDEDLELMYGLYLKMMNPTSPMHPVDIIMSSLDTPENIWWPGFFKAYLEGKIWEIPVYRFQEKIEENDKVDFAVESDTVKFLDRSYPDLSARLFQVNFDNDFPEKALDEGDKLSIKIEPNGLNLDYVKVLVHSFENAQPILLGEGAEVVIDDLKEFIENGNRTLLVTVVNSASEPPYEEEMEIQLTIRVVKERTWIWKYVSFDVSADAVFISNSGDETHWSDNTYSVSEKELNMNEEGTLLYTTWLNQTSDYKYEGGIDITIDPLTDEITGFFIWSNSESLSEGVVTLSEKTEIQGKEGIRIPITYQDGDFLAHQLSGSAVCAAIESWAYDYALYPGESYEYSNTLSSYTCSENADLLFFWSRESEALKSSSAPGSAASHPE